jgi:chromosome segregation ATPase
MDFYTQIIEDEVGSEMKVFGSFGYDIYIDKNETPEEYAAINKMLTSFLESYLPKYYKSEVKATKNKVKDLSKEVKELKEDISNNKEEIEDLSEEIGELSNEVSEKESELSIANTKLQERIEKLERIKSKYKNQ